MNKTWNTPLQKTWHSYSVPIFLVLAAWSIHYAVQDMSILCLSSLVLALVIMIDYILMRCGYVLKIMAAIVLLLFFIHITLAVLYNGWDTGFQYYYFSTLFSIMFLPNFSIRIRVLIAACCLSTYLLLAYANLFGWVEPYPQAAEFAFVYFVINLTYVFSFIAILAIDYQSRLRHTFSLLADVNQKLEQLAATDPLTGLLNRRSMTAELEKASASANENSPYSLLLLDVDHFKSFNDRYGHDCGDLVLKQLSVLLNDMLPQSMISRWGGEEFLIVFPAAKKEALPIAENVRTHIERNALLFKGLALQVTVTIGATTLQSGESVFAAVTRADHGLLRGKAEGRNRVIEC